MPIGSPDDPSHEVRRVVQRLAVVAPRLSEEQEAELCSVMQWLADVAADGAGRARRQVPRLRPHGWADQFAVLGDDALRERPDAASEVAARCAQVRRAW